MTKKEASSLTSKEQVHIIKVKRHLKQAVFIKILKKSGSTTIMHGGSSTTQRRSYCTLYKKIPFMQIFNNNLNFLEYDIP